MTPFDLVLTPRGVQFMGQRFACTIGRGGLTQHKAEGDGATPTGTHTIIDMFYRADRTAAPTHWAKPIGPRDLWCDAPDHPDYNTHVKAPFAASHEVMRRADPMYDIVIATDWNWPNAQPNRGSAIFIHAWRRPLAPTAGCVAFHPIDLFWIAQRIRIGTRLIIRP